MSDKRFHARSKAARAYQAAHPGTSYTRALRLVSHSNRNPSQLCWASPETATL